MTVNRRGQTEAEVYRRLHEVWHYEPDTGVFTRIEPNVQGPPGFEHGFINEQGYRCMRIDNIAYPGARLAWLYMKAKWPERNIKVRNGNKLDLRWFNLYERAPKADKSRGRETLTLERLKEVLEYEPDTGIFRWKVASPRGQIGSEAGVAHNAGYRLMSVDGQRFLGHRLAWFYVHGAWPEHQIDHINGKRVDNRIVNLRQATAGQNAHNQLVRPTNRLGLKGVSPYRGRFKAQIVSGYRIIPLGIFKTPEEAHAAYCEAAKKYHGDFANNGARYEATAEESDP